MVQRFFNKSSRVKYVKPYVNKRVSSSHASDDAKTNMDEQKNIKDNKKNKSNKKNNKDMINVEKLDNMVSGDTNDMDQIPKVVKVEKNKGLIEREKSSKVIITEDNKMLLVD